LNYLKKTKDFGLVYKRDELVSISSFSDADWASDIDSRKSTTGYFVSINGGPISWCSKKQSTVATSTAEAEYMALYETVRESIWVNKLLNDLKVKNIKINLYCDNQSAIHIAKNPVQHQRTKHIDIKYHFIRECIRDSEINTKYLESKMMIADILTKPLAYPQYCELRSKLLNDSGLRGSIGNE